VHADFKRTRIPDDHPVVRMAFQAAERLERPITLQVAGGGSDANVFFQQGILTGVLGTGMSDVHTVREFVDLQDMVQACEMTLALLSVYHDDVDQYQP
jgi:tripeptide aminopeptidase